VLKLVLLFTIVPLVELWLLLVLGEHIGFLPTVLLTIFTAFLGGFLAKREGRRVFREWRQALSEMRVPEEGVLSGVLVLVGAVMLVTPGILTDLTGLLLLFPPTRKLIAGVVRRRLENRIESGTLGGSGFTVKVVDLGSMGAVDVEDEVGGGHPDVIDVEGQSVEEDDRKLLQ
jgi:UPF0716 protein FxsA